jgi:D-arabinose 1-dehydrogenase-like Zn-dependent alcohol dehydrogenase
MEMQSTTIPIPPILGKTLKIQGVTVGPRRNMEDLLVFLAQHRIERVIDATYVEVPITFHHIAQPDVRSHRIPVRVERPCRNLTTVSVSITLP